MANFIIPYTTLGNYTFDNSKIEVSDGVAKLKDITPNSGLLFSDFDVDKDANWADGSKIGTLFADASVSSGQLNLTTTSNNYLQYAGANNTPSGNTGCIRFIFTPNFSGAPTGNRYLYASSNGISNIANMIRIMIASGTSLIRWDLYNSSGTVIATYQTGNTITLTAGVPIEIELNFNTTTGEHRLFINGVNVGGLRSGTGTRTNSSTIMRIGKDYTSSINLGVNGKIDNLVIYDAVQHTSNYTPGATIIPTRYSPDEPTVFKTIGDSIDDIAEWNSFSEILGGNNEGTVRYQLSEDGIDWKYWNGSAWATAGVGEYNGVTDVSTNISNFPTDDNKIYVRAFLISDGDQMVELDENTISFTINTAPLLFAGATKTAIYNVAINPFSDATIEDDEDNIVTAEYKLSDDVSWTNISLGSFATWQEAIRDVSVAFSHSGEKELELRVTDSYDEQVTDSLIIDVDRVNINIIVFDEFENNLPSITFDPGDGSGTSIQDSPFIFPYKIGTHTYTVTNAGFQEASDAVTITIDSTELNIVMVRKSQIGALKINIVIPEILTKGDTFFIDCNVNKDITDWKIRCEIYDDSGNEIRLATENITGGSISQIDIINPENGSFLIKIDDELTENFDTKTYIEIEMENPDGQKRTVWDKLIILEEQAINWESSDED